MTRILKTWPAKQRLAKDVAQRRNSFRIIDYRKRRAAALKGRRT